MKNKIIRVDNFHEEFFQYKGKLQKKRQNALIFTPPYSSIASFNQIDNLNNLFHSEKKMPKISNITNNNTKKKQTLNKSKFVKKQNISSSFYNLSKNLKDENSKKKYNQYSKKKNIRKIKKNICALNIPNKYNSKTKKIILNSNYNIKCFSGRKKILFNNKTFKTANTTFVYHDKKNKCNDNYINYIKNGLSYDDNNKSFKKDNNNFTKDNNNTILKTNKSNIDKINDIKKNNKSNTKIKSKEKDIKSKHNNNNSSKFTSISSYITPNSKKTPNDILKCNRNIVIKNYLDAIKEKLLSKLKTDLNENEIQEDESKFLNYDLGIISDKVSIPNNNDLNDEIKNNENIKKEFERPVEEMEKIANEIFNSGYANRKLSYTKNQKTKTNHVNPSKDIGLNNDIDEFKEGEEIQNVLSLYVHKKNQ